MYKLQILFYSHNQKSLESLTLIQVIISCYFSNFKYLALFKKNKCIVTNSWFPNYSKVDAKTNCNKSLRSASSLNRKCSLLRKISITSEILNHLVVVVVVDIAKMDLIESSSSIWVRIKYVYTITSAALDVGQIPRFHITSLQLVWSICRIQFNP